MLLIVFGLVLLAITLRPTLAWKSWISRREAVFLLVCMAIVPFATTEIRSHSNVQCPATLQSYGGNEPDDSGRMQLSKFLEPRRKSGCWPSGHASGGFALLCLGWLERRRVTQRWLLVPGVVAGLSMGTYQVARGAHFASHVLVTGLLSVLLIQLIAAASGAGSLSATVDAP